MKTTMSMDRAAGKWMIRGIIGVSLLGLQHCSLLESPVEEYPDPEQGIFREVQEAGIPSLSACIVKEDSIIWAGYYGNADLRAPRPTGPGTVYAVASVSKLVVVTAVMQLYERGLIDLEADVNAYLPFTLRNPNLGDQKITVLHLLTHTSGLAWPETDNEVPGIYEYYPNDSGPPLQDWLPRYVQPQGSQYNPAIWKQTPPGTRELYSNIGVAVLGALVEVISGMDFSQFCRQNIFAPLDMPSTSYAWSDFDPNSLATLYGDGGQVIGFYRQLCYPAGNLKTTLEDFSHLLVAYIHGGEYKGRRILQEQTVREILRMRNPASGLCLIWNYTLGNWYGHAGGMPGVAAYAEFQPDHRIGLIIVANYRSKLLYPGNKIHGLVRRIARRYE